MSSFLIAHTKLDTLLSIMDSYYDRIYCWRYFESYNLPSLTPIKFAHAALFKGVL